jgi:hypothetical protein
MHSKGMHGSLEIIEFYGPKEATLNSQHGPEYPARAVK